MKKTFWKSNLWITFLLASFILYSFVNFMLVKEMNIYHWIAFGVTIVSVIGQTIFYEYSMYNNIFVRTKFLKIPILAVGTIVTMVEVCMVVIFSLTGYNNMFIMIMSQMVVVAIYMAVIIGSFFDKNSHNDNDKKHENDYIDTIASEIKKIEALTDDLNYKVFLHRLYDKIRLSEKTSPKEAQNIEIQINNKVVSLKKISTKGDSNSFRREVNELGRLIEDRNRICRLY